MTMRMYGMFDVSSVVLIVLVTALAVWLIRRRPSKNLPGLRNLGWIFILFGLGVCIKAAIAYPSTALVPFIVMGVTALVVFGLNNKISNPGGGKTVDQNDDGETVDEDDDKSK